MRSVAIRRAVAVAAVAATAACTIHDTEPPPLSGPSQLAVALSIAATPDSITQDGGSQSAIRVTAIGPDGRGMSGLGVRLDMRISGVPQDYGTLSARTLVTGSDGTTSAVYTSPPRPVDGNFGTCNGLPGTCVTIVATPTSTNFNNANPENTIIRLVPPGVILPPASTPTASFTVSPSQPSAGVPANFDASASQAGAGATGISSYQWSFGDGSTGSGRTISHTYTAGGTYTASLTVTNDRGLTATATNIVLVGNATLPTATFTFSPTAPGVNEPVFFNGGSSTPGAGHLSITSYRWTFGDGGTGSGQTVSHAYAAAGTYTVQLTVTDDAGSSATSGGQGVNVGNPPGPTANFTVSPATPAVGDTVIFDWRTTTTPQGQQIVSLDWNFGDSTPVVHCPGDAACTAAGITTHVFNLTGTFTVNLVVRDSAGRTGVKSQTVTIASGNPIPTCTVSPASVAIGGTVNLSARNTTVFSGASITAYSWNFGDGSSSTVGPDVSHVYAGPAGTKTVTVTVTDSLGRQGSGTCSVTVQ